MNKQAINKNKYESWRVSAS